MTTSRFVMPFQVAVNQVGVPIPGAKLGFYVSGSDTLANTYSNSGLTIANTNPVVADSAGTFPNIFMQAISYKVVLSDAQGNEIWTADPVTGT